MDQRVDNSPQMSPKVRYVMDWKAMVPTLLTGGIFFIGFLSLLLVSFNAMLDARITPIKQDISRLDTDIKAMDAKLDQLILVVAKIEHKTK